MTSRFLKRMTDYVTPHGYKQARFQGGSRDGLSEPVPLGTDGRRRASIALSPLVDVYTAADEPHEIVTRSNPETYDWNGDDVDAVYTYRDRRGVPGP